MLKLLKPFVKSNKAKHYASETSGNIGMMFGFMIVVLIGGLAIAIDLSSAFAAKQRLQNTTDAIALLAARDGIEDQSELQAAAQAYFDQAYPNESGERIEVLNISRNGDRVDVQTRNNIDTYFSQFFGRSDLDVSVRSSTVFAQQSLDVALVLDTTGSMRGTKLASLKTSATRLMDTFESFNNDDLRVSIVPFAQYVNVGTNQRNEAWVRGRSNNRNALCMGSRSGTLNTEAAFNGNAMPVIPNAICGAAVQPLTNDFGALKSTINSLVARGFTYAPSGLAWGWRTLDERAPFEEAATSGRGQKVLVLMTDGANTRSVGANRFSNNGPFHEGANRVQADNVTSDLCESVKDSDITVYTIAFEVPDAGTRNLLRDCATSSANFFNATNASELDDAFSDIASTLNELRITS